MVTKFMAWVDRLPEVGGAITTVRDRLARELASAVELEGQAARLRARVKLERMDLVARVASQWSLLEIERASLAAEHEAHAVPLACIEDAALRAAIRGLDGASSALDALEMFYPQVVRQGNLLGAVGDVERRATLSRALDWWTFAVLPVLARVEG